MSKKSLISELSNEQLDELLTYTPAFSNENLANIKTRSLEKINHKEKPVMQKNTIKFSFSTVAAVALVFMLLTTTAFAAWHFLGPSDVADKMGNSALSAAFESESAVNINEAIEADDYIFTLLAIVSGSDITDHPIYNSNGDILSDRTYAVLAIQKADGSPMPSPMDDEYEPFMISPFIKGQKLWQVNAFTLYGGYSAIVVDGILYIMFDCSDITMFADRGVYLGVNKGLSMSNLLDAFVLNEQTGEITANPYFDGPNVIFELPFDKNLADPEKAEQFLNNLF